MRHGKHFNHLGRTAPHRKAMLMNMACSLILHKKINTTIAKAKALREFVEPIITSSKEDTTHSRRLAYSYLQDKEAVKELFREVAVKVAQRPGGYTRILKTGNRLGDNADMCLMELVDYNMNLASKKGEKTTKSPKTRRGASKKKDAAKVEKEPVAKKESAEAPVKEAPEAN